MEYNLPIDSIPSENNFIKYFIRKSGLLTLRPIANKGELGKLGIRINSWRLFLGIFSEDATHEEWLSTLTKSRENYTNLKNSYKITDPLLGVILKTECKHFKISKWNIKRRNKNISTV